MHLRTQYLKGPFGISINFTTQRCSKYQAALYIMVSQCIHNGDNANVYDVCITALLNRLHRTKLFNKHGPFLTPQRVTDRIDLIARGAMHVFGLFFFVFVWSKLRGQVNDHRAISHTVCYRRVGITKI